MISVTITITLILLPLPLFHDFKSDAFPTVCARRCRCSVCPMIGMQNLTKMKCNASTLKDIHVPQNTCSLVLSGNKVSVLEKRVLRSFNGILSLDLSFNEITMIPRRVFFDVKSLKILYLNKNLISTIHKDGLTWMKQLQYLDMSFNLIAKLPQKVFNGLRSARTLNISFNILKGLTGNMTFRGLPSLTELDLSHNGLENLTNDVFRGLLSLKTLYLQHNNITSIQDKAFSVLRTIEHLDMSFNLITALPKGTFLGLKSMKTLNISYNAIQVLRGKLSFKGLQSLNKLDLRNNGLKSLTNNMFRGMQSLKSLYLQHNNITVVETKAFHGLLELELLDLSYNKIVTLSYQVFNIRFNLKQVNLDGNNVTVWLGSPSKNTVAVLSRYTKTGAANSTQLKYIPQQIEGCFDIRQEPITKQSSRKKTRCPDGQDCVVVMNKTKIDTTRSNICWIVINKLRPTLFILGSIAMVLNITVLGTVLRVGSLRKSPPFLLVSHLGFCDTLVGIYSMGIALGHGFSFKEFNDWKEIYCPALRSIFIFAEVNGSLTSLLMTAERYLAIVFCMKPAVRLGHKVIAAALALAWIVGASSATVVQMLDKRNNQKDGQMCLITRNTSKTSTIYASELILLVLVFLYFVIVVLYFHIFIVVRRSARNMGVLRESRLAKRISAIVLSSFFFFAVPNCTTVSFIFRGGNVFEDARLNRTLIWWLPPVCLVVNACLDPCLFAFRNEKFFRALRKVACRHPFGRLLTKNRPERKDPHTAYNSAINLTAHLRSDLSSSIELTSFTTTDISKA